MAKYKEGQYLILRFDEYGTKIDSVSATDQTLQGAVTQGEEMIQSGEAASIAVLRVLHNTIDARQRWVPQQQSNS